MIAPATLALFAALAAEPCTPEEPRARGGPVDREAATLYRAVGDEARARGDLPRRRPGCATSAGCAPEPSPRRAVRPRPP